MGNKISSPIRNEEEIVEEVEIVRKSVYGRELVDILGSESFIKQSWSDFCKEDFKDDIPLEEHCGDDRYYSRFVYKHSKVILNDGRYINANFVLNRSYIACQAPLQHTLVPFWDMIFQENVHLIVMLTKVTEGSRTKALRYWPTSNHPSQIFGDKDNKDKWSMELKDKSVFEDNILLRELTLTRKEDGAKRNIYQLQYIGWPDHGCPSEISEVLALLLGVQQHLDKESSSNPILVHCSAGIGRTGTFITIRHVLLNAIEKFKKQENYQELSELDVDGKIEAIKSFLSEYEFPIDSTVAELRKDRKMMVQRDEQLMFCYEVFQYLIEDQNDYTFEEFVLPLFFT